MLAVDGRAECFQPVIVNPISPEVIASKLKLETFLQDSGLMRSLSSSVLLHDYFMRREVGTGEIKQVTYEKALSIADGVNRVIAGDASMGSWKKTVISGHETRYDCGSWGNLYIVDDKKHSIKYVDCENQITMEIHRDEHLFYVDRNSDSVHFCPDGKVYYQMFDSVDVHVESESVLTHYSDGVKILRGMEADGTTLTVVARTLDAVVGAWFSNGNYEIFNRDTHTTLLCVDGVISLIPHTRASMYISQSELRAMEGNDHSLGLVIVPGEGNKKILPKEGGSDQGAQSSVDEAGAK
jgi:hypothetical protein